MRINWYPGHMAKARRMMEDSLKLVDAVIEIVDARIPAAGRNPDFDTLFSRKKRIIILNKSDLAIKEATKAWIKYYTDKGWHAMHYDATRKGGKGAVASLIQQAVSELLEKAAAKGMKKTIRCLVAGIPNSGKSTFINSMSAQARARTGDTPGVTRGKQWVSISPYLELLDTPGVLWPKLENQSHAAHLAYVGSINDDIMDVEELAAMLLSELISIVPDAVMERYGVDKDTPMEIMLDEACKRRGFLLSGGRLDTARAAGIILDEFRAGRLGRVTLERPEEGGGL
ncbi:MAG: ribosome biogenesis GTPase YlqF [Christensenellales bacterium]